MTAPKTVYDDIWWWLTETANFQLTKLKPIHTTDVAAVSKTDLEFRNFDFGYCSWLL